MSQKKDPKAQRAAFERIVRTYSEQLYWTVRRIVLNHEDANDVVQNVLMKAWMRLDSFHEESKMTTWLYRITLNESIDFMRKQKKQQLSADDPSAITVAQQLMADEYFDGSEMEARLHEAIARLPDVQRTVFNLRYFNEMKYSEMSEVLHTSEGSLKASYHIAVKKITEYLKQQD